MKSIINAVLNNSLRIKVRDITALMPLIFSFFWKSVSASGAMVQGNISGSSIKILIFILVPYISLICLISGFSRGFSTYVASQQKKCHSCQVFGTPVYFDEKIFSTAPFFVIKKGFFRGWKTLHSDRFIIETNVAMSEAKLMLKMAHAILARHEKAFGSGSTEKFKIRCFKAKDQFNSYARTRDVTNAEGFYDIQNEEIVVYFQDKKSFYSLLAHEFNHGFVIKYFGTGVSSWLLEGLAEHFSSGAKRHLPLLLSLSKLPHVSDILKMSQGEFILREKIHVNYAISWLLVHYLIQKNSFPGVKRLLESAERLNTDQLQQELEDYLYGQKGYF